MIKATVFICLLAGSVLTAHSQGDPNFRSVMERLDRDGSLFSYMGSEHLLREIEEMVSKGVPPMVEMQGGADEAEPFLDLASRAYETSGISQLAGVGMSRTKLPGGLSRSKMVLKKNTGEGMLWSLLGDDVLADVKALPADTAAAGAFDFEPDQLLRWIKRTVRGSPAEDPFEQGLEDMREQVDIERLAKEIDSGLFFLRVHPTKKIDLDLDGEKLRIAEHYTHVQVKTSGDTLLNLVRKLSSKDGEAKVFTSKAAGVDVFSVLTKEPDTPSPSWAMKDGMFHYATHKDELVKRLEAKAGASLGENKEFGELLGKVDAAQGVFFISEAWGEFFADLQEGPLEQLSEQELMVPGMDEFLKKILNGKEPGGSLTTVAMDGDFLDITSVEKGSVGSGFMGIAGVGFAAGIFAPLAEVREDAKRTEMKANGKNLYTTVFADSVDDALVGFPTSATYKNSTDYFKKIGTTRGVLGARPSFVGYPGVAGAPFDWEKLTAQHVGWNVVPDFDETADAGTPFLVSANLKIKSLGDDWSAALDRAGPLKGHVIFAYHGAGSEVIPPERLEAHKKNLLLNFPDLKKAKVLNP